MSEWKSLCISFISQESFLDGPMWQKLLLKMAAGKENMICLLSPLSVKVSQNENHHRSAPREIKVALYYVKFSVTGWKLISTLNNCADLRFFGATNTTQCETSGKWRESGTNFSSESRPMLCPSAKCCFFSLFFFFFQNASDALWLGLCLNRVEAHTQILFS